MSISTAEPSNLHSPSVAIGPQLQRDLNIAVDEAVNAAQITAHVDALLRQRANAFACVDVLSETSYLDLSTAARRRLGIKRGQKNVQLRLLISGTAQPASSQLADEVRDAVYAALHEGDVMNWAGRETL